MIKLFFWTYNGLEIECPLRFASHEEAKLYVWTLQERPYHGIKGFCTCPA